MDGCRRRTYQLLVSLFAACLLVFGLAVSSSSAKPKSGPEHGPSGLSFYKPPKHLGSSKKHGDLIWWRKIHGPAAMQNASENDLLLYRSTGLDGKPVAVSGTLSIPKGKAPKGGWPIVDYDHGTTGIADSCAPSRDSASSPAHDLISYIYPDVNGWLDDGYAVLRTDFEGLGTPGVHPYLIGKSAGRSTLDIVKASQQLNSSLGQKVAFVGHSQGGHAAIWAAGLAPTYTPNMKVVGTVAFAPASHLAEQVPVVRAVNAKVPGLAAIASLVIRAVDTANPSIGTPSLLSDDATPLYPQTKTLCLGELAGDDSFGGLELSDIFDSSADVGPFIDELAKNNPGKFDLKKPLLIEQGEADTTVFPSYTQQLQDELTDKGSKSTLHTYPGVDHGGVVTGAPLADANAFLAKKLK